MIVVSMLFSLSFAEPPQQDAAARIKQLRSQELAELEAASKARQMQHQLQVAEAEFQIAALHRPQQQQGPALTAYQLVGVLQGQQPLVVLRLEQQLLRLIPGERQADGLMVSVDRAHVKLSRGQESRLIALPSGW